MCIRDRLKDFSIIFGCLTIIFTLIRLKYFKNNNIADIFEGGDISIDNVIREAVKDSIEDWFSRNLRPIVEESVKQEISKLFKKRN